jgi:hypothetical protein
MKHPIKVPPGLFADWLAVGRKQYSEPALLAGFVAEKAAEWAADQELDKCCEWLEGIGQAYLAERLRAAMRPKPPSLKEQALSLLEPQGTPARLLNEEQLGVLRRAIESVPDES